MNSSKINDVIIKHWPGWFLFEVLRLKMILWACFVASGLKLIFHCRAHSFILERSLFNRLAESVILWTTENSDVSSIKCFAFEFESLGKSLMQIKNNKGPRIDPCEKPALTSAYDKCWPFNTTLCFLQLKKSVISPDIPLCCNLKSKPSFQTLLNTLNILRKTSLTSWPSSNAERILCAIDSNWLVQESPDLNPDCYNIMCNYFLRNGVLSISWFQLSMKSIKTLIMVMRLEKYCKWLIKRPGLTLSPNKRPVLRKKNMKNAKVRISA